MEIIESFSNLIDSLAQSLESGKEINYSSHLVPSQSAIGVFLSRLPNYKQHLKKKLQDEYKNKQKLLKLEVTTEPKFKDFEIYVKKIFRLAEINSVHFARFQRNYIRKAIEKTRKWVFKSISTLQREKNYCEIMMNNSSNNYQVRLKQFMDDYSWKKFLNYLQVISMGFAKISERKLAKGMKERIEDYLKHSVKVSRFVCIENLYYNDMNGEKKVQTKLSNYSESYVGKGIGDVAELFGNFLTLQNSNASIVECKKPYRKEALLSRSVISHLSSPAWRPLTLHFYLEESGMLTKEFTPEFTFEETQASGSLRVIEWKPLKSIITITLAHNSNSYTLRPATLAHLISLKQLFYLDIPRFKHSQNIEIRPLSSLQQKELLRIYTSLNSPVLYPDIIPEPDLYKFTHEYLLASHTQNSRSANSSRNWLIQIQKDQQRLAEQTICAWEGCFSSKSVAPVDFKVNDIGKTRKKLKKIAGNEFCRFHQCVNLTSGNKKKPYSSELWPAVQSGLLWQNSMKSTSILGKIVTNKSSEIIGSYLDYRPLSISSYKSEKQLEIDKIVSNPDSCKKFREKLLTEIADLKRNRDFESAATEELKKLSEFTNLSTSICQDLKCSFSLNSQEKMLAFSKLRERVTRLSQNEVSRNFSNRSSRPSSAAREKQKEEIIKRKESKLMASPYLQQIPDKGPSFRLKHVSNTGKVPKSRSFALLDV